MIVATVCSAVVGQLAHGPKFKGLNPATTDTFREKIDKKVLKDKMPFAKVLFGTIVRAPSASIS